MPDKPWEKYATTDGGGSGAKPWETYSNNSEYRTGIKDFNPDLFVKDDNQLENTLKDIRTTSKTAITDSEIDVLRDILKNPNTTGDQAKEAIQTIQGYHPKFGEEGKTSYYMKKDDNGVIVPKPLAYGQRPPRGYDVASVWGNQKQADDDSWYTDLGKSLFNGVVGAAKGVAQLGNLASLGITGEESNALNSATNTLESFQFKKDSDLNAPIFNTEGINEWADLIDKDRFDLSPKALWGTLNMAAESVAGFMTGAGAAGTAIKGISGAANLGKAGISASAFTGSFLQQLGDNIENAKEAGLEGRDIAAFATAVTAGQAAIDAKFGLESNIYKNLFGKTEKEIIKEFGKSLERTVTGELTEEGFKDLVKGTVLAYDQVASNAVKTGIKNTLKEGAQEVGQDFVAKAGEQLYDKLSPEDRANFGTHATDAKSFGSYMQNFAAGIIGGVPMAAFAGDKANDFKKQYDRQSVNAFKIVEGGQDKINEFKANVYAAQRRGDLTEQQRDQAVFKVDAYDKYWNQTKDIPNMSKEDKQEAFKLSFNIEALKSEIPKDLEDLDPIAIAKVKNKEELIKGLQKDLNHILLRQEFSKEPIIAESTVDKVMKEEGLETERGEGENKTEKSKNSKINELLKKFNPKVEAAEQIDLEDKYSDEMDAEVDNVKSQVRRPINKFTTLGWNTMAVNNPLRVKAIVGEHLKSTPNNEMDVVIRSGKNGVLTADIGENKQVRFAQSKESTEGNENFFKYENLPDSKVAVEDKGGNANQSEESEPEFYYEEPVKLKRVDFKSKTAEGKPMTKNVLVAYNPKKGFLGFIREHRVGKSSHYSEQDKKQLQKIINDNYVTEAQGQENNQQVSPKKAAGSPAAKPVVNPAEVFARNHVQPMPSHHMVNEEQRARLVEDGYDNTTIDKAIDEADRILALPAHEAFIELGNKGIFNLGRGEKMDVRPDVGLSAEEYNNTVRQLESGKPSKTVDKLLDFVDKVKETGLVPIIQGTGGHSVKVRIPLVMQLLGEKSNQGQGLSAEEEQAELEKLQAQEQYEAQLQKERAVKGDAFKIIERMKKVAPKVNWVYDNKLKAAAQVKGNTITVNPFYAGLDTPIHEMGHILIDTLGYNNKVIQAAIKQLKDTYLWRKTKESETYKNLTEEQLGKEVLAEAIGREGAGIFEDTVAKSRFKQILDYIFDKLKRMLGLDKNVAKTLAEQIISGIGTQGLEGKNQEVQRQQYSKETKSKLKELVDNIESRSLADTPFEELNDVYNIISQAYIEEEISGQTKNSLLKPIMKRMALNLKSRGLAEAEKKVTEQQVKFTDIKWIDTFYKALSHFGDMFPDMKFLSKIYDSTFLKKVKEAEQLKNTHAKLAEAVIKEKNKKLGITERAGILLRSILSDQKHKYFSFLDNKGKVITVAEAKSKGYSEAQIKYIEFVRDVMAKSMEIPGDEAYNADMDIIKLNKGFGESMQTEGIMSAFSGFMSDSMYNNIRIKFINPITKKEQVTEFKNVKAIISKYAADGGVAEKTKAVKALFKYTGEVKRQFALKEHFDGGRENWPAARKAEPMLDPDGKLPSRFGDERGKDNASYSNDFYNIMNDYIDDYTHTKYMSSIVPVVQSLEYLAKNGLDETGAHKKPMLAKWFDKWEKQHLFRVADENDRITDKVLRSLRFLTSTTGMMFNFFAQGMNITVGQLANIFDMTAEEYLTGLKRMTVNFKYTMDIIDKYHGVSIDKTSNPLRTGMGFISEVGFAGMKWGEIFNQGIGIAGRMSEDEFNSFEYKENQYGVKELVVKEGVDAKKLEEKIQKDINKVSDIHGKYGEKDRRNIMNNQWGQALMQFHVWIPDFLRVRFGDQGRYSRYWQGAITEMKEAVRKDGVVKAFWNDKKFMSAFKELATIAFLMSLVYDDDDDKEKSALAAFYKRTLSDLLFVFDMNNAKFTIEHPLAVVGTVEKIIDLADHLVAVESDDFYKGKSTWGNKGESKVRGDVMNFVPGKSAIKYVVDESEED